MDTSDIRPFEEDIARIVPGFQVRWKPEYWHQRLVGKVLGSFNPQYLTTYTTTFYPYVYFPTKEYYDRIPLTTFMILAHERVHLQDTKDAPLWFRASYLLPQLLALPLLLVATVVAFWSWWAVLPAVVGLACLAPWPSPWRVRWEQRGYAMSLAVLHWSGVRLTDEVGAWAVKQFSGSGYYKMSWSTPRMTSWYETTRKSILDGTIEDDPVYGDVKRYMLAHGLVKT